MKTSRTFVAALLLSGSALLASPPTDRRVSAVDPSKKSSTSPSDAVRCTSCVPEVEGRLSVDTKQLRFCCRGTSGADSLVTAKCPYSFSIPLTAVKAQRYDSAAEEWVVATTKYDYVFTSAGSTLEALSGRLASAVPGSPQLVSSKPTGDTRRPHLVAAGSCP